MNPSLSTIDIYSSVQNSFMKVTVVHYGEIGIKGKNRMFFERKLMNNLKKATGKNVKKSDGRLIIEDHVDPEILRKIPGVEYFGHALKVRPDEITKAVDILLKDRDFETFKVIAKRYDKSFPKTSMDVNKEIGAYIVEKYGKKVSMKDYDLGVYIEICKDSVYVYVDRFSGIGGLPVSSQGKVVSLLSGGIDSPVASFFLMKRGCEVVFIHFFNKTLHTRDSLKKVEKLVDKLTEIQLSSRLYLIPFYEIQREIIARVPSKYRMLIYRRSMMRIANMVAEREGAKGIVTGDDLGQVASQTLDNLNCIYSQSRYPVLPPLLGLDKKEIIEIAKKIGTYEISNLPYEDCCSFMIARHPETRGSPEVLEKIESTISGLDYLEKDALVRAEIKQFVYPRR